MQIYLQRIFVLPAVVEQRLKFSHFEGSRIP